MSTVGAGAGGASQRPWGTAQLGPSLPAPGGAGCCRLAAEFFPRPPAQSEAAAESRSCPPPPWRRPPPRDWGAPKPCAFSVRDHSGAPSGHLFPRPAHELSVRTSCLSLLHEPLPGDKTCTSLSTCYREGLASEGNDCLFLSLSSYESLMYYERLSL